MKYFKKKQTVHDNLSKYITSDDDKKKEKMSRFFAPAKTDKIKPEDNTNELLQD